MFDVCSITRIPIYRKLKLINVCTRQFGCINAFVFHSLCLSVIGITRQFVDGFIGRWGRNSSCSRE